MKLAHPKPSVNSFSPSFTPKRRIKIRCFLDRKKSHDTREDQRAILDFKSSRNFKESFMSQLSSQFPDIKFKRTERALSPKIPKRKKMILYKDILRKKVRSHEEPCLDEQQKMAVYLQNMHTSIKDKAHSKVKDCMKRNLKCPGFLQRVRRRIQLNSPSRNLTGIPTTITSTYLRNLKPKCSKRSKMQCLDPQC
ncbi:unnamed protein product [Moneuplotes crassus]|uniref:Uncharacterized protein n=1 Tax=Euplotes crassus TaxID=5936 RepID=A0AAD2D804_EUPCR|nr:unnamed protein product [Moneuplotes crassus]